MVVAKAPDPITVEVIKNALVSIGNEMSMAFRRTSMSPVIYGMLDFCVDLFDSNVELIAEGRGSVCFQGTVNYGIRSVINHIQVDRGDRIEEGDVFISAWSYFAGSHNPDVLVFKPIFYEKEIVAYAAAKAHWTDIGAAYPFGANYTDMFQEGLILPGVKVVKRGELDKEIVDIVRYNTRLPNSTVGDLLGQIACCNIGEKRLLSLIGKYGIDTYTAAIAEIMDRDEVVMRRRIAEIPDGDYSGEGALDSNGLDDNPVDVRVKVSVRGDEMIIDTSGSAWAQPGPTNAPYPSTVAICRAAVKMLLDPHTRSSGGHWRPLTVVAPEGSMYNPLPPTASYLYGWTIEPLGECVFMALAKALPKMAVARSGGDICAGYRFQGVDPRDGKIYVCPSGQGPVGHGASFGRDGGDALIIYAMSGSELIPHEIMEETFPIRVEEYCLRQDSGGPGRFRGGLGIKRTIRVLTDTVGGAVIEQTKFPAWGLCGGKEGLPNIGILWPGTEKETRFGKITQVRMKAEDPHTILTGGGGGWGDPYERDASAVLTDVIRGYVSLDSAAKDYGVAIREQDGEYVLDEAATERLRSNKSTVA